MIVTSYKCIYYTLPTSHTHIKHLDIRSTAAQTFSFLGSKPTWEACGFGPRMILSLTFHQDVFIKRSAPNMGERKREEVETETEKDRQREYSSRPTADDYQIFFLLI